MGVVVYMRSSLEPTHCADCDPGCGHPLALPVRRDPRTDEILTPCPACGRFALVPVLGTVRRREGTPRPRRAHVGPGHLA